MGWTTWLAPVPWLRPPAGWRCSPPMRIICCRGPWSAARWRVKRQRSIWPWVTARQTPRRFSSCSSAELMPWPPSVARNGASAPPLSCLRIDLPPRPGIASELVAGAKLVDQIRRDLAVLDPLHRQREQRVLRGRGDRVAPLRLISVLASQPDVDMLARPVSPPARHVQHQAFDARRLDDDLAHADALPGEPPQ